MQHLPFSLGARHKNMTHSALRLLPVYHPHTVPIRVYNILSESIIVLFLYTLTSSPVGTEGKATGA
jgi:hypothetical protein